VRLAPLFVLVLASLVSSRARAEDFKVEILEPKQGATLTRRNVRVLAAVDSSTKAAVAKLTFDHHGYDETTVDMKAIAGRDGCFEATVAVRGGTVNLVTHVEDSAGRRAVARISIDADLSLRGNEKGQPSADAPSAKAKDASGNEVTIDSKGALVLVHFYSAWDDCQAEVEWLKTLEKDFAKTKLVIVGVASVLPENYEAWLRYLEKVGADWKSVPDPDGAIGDKWWRSSHAHAGEQALMSATYLMKEGKITARDYMAWDTDRSESDTKKELARLARRLAIGESLNR